MEPATPSATPGALLKPLVIPPLAFATNLVSHLASVFGHEKTRQGVTDELIIVFTLPGYMSS
jgi:hypothetical protein